MPTLGVRLYEPVCGYAGIGAHHRTGTGEDARTLDWFEGRLRVFGATSERQPSRAWCTLGRPLLSMAGGFPLFHTPEDVPERATTPALLERVHHAVFAAVHAMARALRSS